MPGCARSSRPSLFALWHNDLFPMLYITLGTHLESPRRDISVDIVFSLIFKLMLLEFLQFHLIIWWCILNTLWLVMRYFYQDISVISVGNKSFNSWKKYFLLEQSNTVTPRDEYRWRSGSQNVLVSFENAKRVWNRICRLKKKKKKKKKKKTSVYKLIHNEFKMHMLQDEIFPSRFANLIKKRMLMCPSVYRIYKHFGKYFL